MLSGNPVTLIDPTQLPVDPDTCAPIYPNHYLKVNTVFEVAHAHQLRTAWSDKHPAYQILSGPSSQGVDEYFTPEINSSADPLNPTSQGADDWTKDNLNTQKYDNYKVQAVVNWINGHAHDGTGNPGTPAIFGMNFQSVSTAQKLPMSHTKPADSTGPIITAAGGYQADGVTPGVVLQNALDFIDLSLGSMVSALSGVQLPDQSTLLDHTAIIISAKHGQSPMKLSALNRIKDSTIIKALNAAWNKDHQKGDPTAQPLVAQGTDDDGVLLWLNDKSNAAAQYARHFLLNYNDSSASVDGKPVIAAGLTEVYAGVAAAQFMGVDPHDPRVPDVIGIAQYGVVYTGGHGKIAEHGGNHFEDRNVPILIALPAIQKAKVVSQPVETTQIAPTILELLGLDSAELKAVQIEGTQPLF
jgi:hypothetical protein